MNSRIFKVRRVGSFAKSLASRQGIFFRLFRHRLGRFHSSSGFLPRAAGISLLAPSRVLKNSFFDALRAVQGWIADFNVFQLGEIVRSAGIHFRPIVVEKSQDGFFQHPARDPGLLFLYYSIPYQGEWLGVKINRQQTGGARKCCVHG
mgnify:CR=1 FL=1